MGLNISGGTFTSSGAALKKYVKDTDTGHSRTITVSGGTFSSPVPTDFCAEGYVPVTNNDNTYGVGKEFPVEVWTGFSGTKVAGYKTVAEAAAGLGENRWIVITADYTLEADFTIPANVYLDVAAGADQVIVDTQVIANAPVRLLKAGIGDAFSTYFEAKACYMSHSENCLHASVTRSALAISKACFDIVYSYGLQAVEDCKDHKVSEALENVIEANIYLSGIGFESGGEAIGHGLHNAFTLLCCFLLALSAFLISTFISCPYNSRCRKIRVFIIPHEMIINFKGIHTGNLKCSVYLLFCVYGYIFLVFHNDE